VWRGKEVPILAQGVRKNPDIGTGVKMANNGTGGKKT